MDTYDVAIAGGGPAGSAAAIALARAGLRVLVADAAAAPVHKIGEGLPPNARSLLDALGVGARIAATRPLPSYGTLAAWGSPALHANDTIFGVHGAGFTLDRAAFDAALRDAAAAAGAEVVADARLSLVDDAASRDGLRLALHTAHGEREIHCQRAIDASGRSAALARRLGAARRRDEPLVAFHLRLAPSQDGDASGTTLVESVRDGWWYGVRLPRGELLVALLVDAAQADRGLRDADGLMTALDATTHLRERVAAGGYRPVDRPRGADASGGRLDRACGERWLAVGDAAIAFDPLSSKGIANALYTGLAGARATQGALAGDHDAPERYAAHVAAIHAAYRAQLAHVYALERRWRDAPFWRRRAARSGETPVPAPTR